MPYRRLALLSISLLLVAGCASRTPTGAGPTNDMPPTDERAAIYIGRPYTADTSFVPLQMEVNGHRLASVGMNEYTRIDVPPGTYKLAAADVYLTWISFGTPIPTEVTAQAGGRYFVIPRSYEGPPRMGVGMNGSLVVPTTTAKRWGALDVTEIPPGAAIPAAFNGLSYVAPNSGEIWKP
jgi:hypothetical protein